jgi:hypothetical protein
MTKEFFEVNPHIALGRSESAAVMENEHERDLYKIERILGHSLDGDGAIDGYSLDGASDMLLDGLSVEEVVEEIREAKRVIANERAARQAALARRQMLNTPW